MLSTLSKTVSLQPRDCCEVLIDVEDEGNEEDNRVRHLTEAL